MNNQAENDLNKASAEGFELHDSEDGVTKLYKSREDQEPLFICSRLIIVGQSRDSTGGGWSTVMEFDNRDNETVRISIPLATIGTNKQEVLKLLFDRGLYINTASEAQKQLQIYLSTNVSKRFTSVTKSGWHGDSFVLPGDAIGDGEYFLENAGVSLGRKGSSEAWRKTVGKYCIGNSRLAFAASAAFASPLLEVLGQESGGIHFVGGSSQGKTKALQIGSSIFGITVRNWSSTNNGLEELAGSLNDIGVALDEIGQASEATIGEASYLLGNGGGKTRAQKYGGSAPYETWRLIYLSTGEVTLNQMMSVANRKTKAGQELRMLNIASDAGKKMGIFERLHDVDTPNLFADLITLSCEENKGYAGPEFVEWIIANKTACKNEFAKQKESWAKLTEHESSQVQRVASKFALISAAGELASMAKITGWKDLEATRAAAACFEAWRKTWATSGDQEHLRIIEQIRSFIQKDRARFPSNKLKQAVPQCAGYMCEESPKPGIGREYWIIKDVLLNEICKGTSPTAILKALKDHRYLVTQEEKSGKVNSFALRTPDGQKRQRYCVVEESILEDISDTLSA